MVRKPAGFFIIFFDFLIAPHSLGSQVLLELTSRPGFFFKMVDVITDVPIASLSCPLYPAPISNCPSANCCQWPCYTPACSLASLLQFCPLSSLLRSLCSLNPNICSYFVCPFILFIRFHIKVKSYGIGLCLTGLLHLA